MWKSFLTKQWPNLLIVALCLMLYAVNGKVKEYRHRADTLETTVSNLNQEVRQTKIRLYDSIELYQAQVRNLDMTRKNLKARYDKLLAASSTKPKDVSSVAEVASVVHEIDTVIAEVDSFGGVKANLTDPFVNIDVTVFPDRKTIIEYMMRDSLTILNVQKKHSWLFGLIKWNEHKETKVINHNPKAKVVSLQTIDIFE